MILAAHQPNYLPWLGYFSKMKNSDIFVILDDVQYIRRSYINRTRILGPNGDFYLSVPVKLNSRQKISEVTIDESFVIKNHFESIRHAYARAPNFTLYKDNLLSIYSKKYINLIEINMDLINFIKTILNIDTRIAYLSDTGILANKSELMVSLCKHFGADTYLSGQGAKVYMEEDLFLKNQIKVIYHDFEHPVYPQRKKKFIQGLSAIDFIFNCADFQGKLR